MQKNLEFCIKYERNDKKKKKKKGATIVAPVTERVKKSKNRKSVNKKQKSTFGQYVFFEKIPFFTKVINLEQKMTSIIQEK